MAGKRYSREFKDEAVKLVESGTNVRQAATELGISEHTLRDWVKAASRRFESGKLRLQSAINVAHCLFFLSLQSSRAAVASMCSGIGPSPVWLLQNQAASFGELCSPPHSRCQPMLLYFLL